MYYNVNFMFWQYIYIKNLLCYNIFIIFRKVVCNMTLLLVFLCIAFVTLLLCSIENRSTEQFKLRSTFFEIDYFCRLKRKSIAIDYILLKCENGRLTLIINPESNYLAKNFDEQFNKRMLKALKKMMVDKLYVLHEEHSLEYMPFNLPLKSSR